jgi:HEAT repeat protein
LRIAVRDGDRDVRIAACEALAASATPQSFALLAEVLRSDTDVDVRLAATRLLGESPEASAVEALGQALDDDDPAVQYLAVPSLRQVTGREEGDDLAEWKRIAQELKSPGQSGEGREADSIWR